MPAALLPPRFVDRMLAFLGPDEWAAYQAALQQPPQVGLRVNTLKLSVEAFRARAPWDLAPVPWCPAGFRLVEPARPGKHLYHAAGLYYIQDPSAMAPAEILAPRPGERVLDLAAAPGGKTTHLAALMQGQGLLVANDVQPKRVHELTNNLDRWGATHIVVTQEQPVRLARRWPGAFDRVLLDAPCSGEGMFRKDPAARRVWSPKHIQRCARLQHQLLQAAARLVRPGGYLVYSTCTFAPEENEGVVARFLARHPDFQVEPVPPRPGFSPGRPEWLQPPGPPDLRHAVRLWPHKAPGEGHFVVLLRRTAGPEPAVPARPRRRLPAQARRLWRAFVDQVLGGHAPVPPEALGLFGNRLYAVPDAALDWQGLKVTRFGWWLGTVKPGRFEPAHALALALRPDQVPPQRRWDLTADDERARAFLHGHPLPSPGPDGWTLVTVDGFPIGWGKRVAGVLKSHAPRWLRRI